MVWEYQESDRVWDLHDHEIWGRVKSGQGEIWGGVKPLYLVGNAAYTHTHILANKRLTKRVA